MLIGVDEAGRGPLAGPVIAAAVGWISEPNIVLKDSKMLSSQARDKTFALLTPVVTWAIGSASAQEIDQLNIRQATLLAMRRAIDALNVHYTSIIIDGLDIPQGLEYTAQALIKADQKIPQVSAASIIAKVFRDRIMSSIAQHYPEYAFEKHKGYPTAQHRALTEHFGLSPIHRRTFCKWL